MKYFILLILFISTFFAQSSSKVDSLQNALRNSKTDFEKAKIVNGIANHYLTINDDSSKKYIALNIHFAEKSNDLLALGLAHIANATYQNNYSNFDIGIKECFLAIEYFERANEKIWLGRSFITVGYAYKRMADAQKLLDFTKKGKLYIQKGIEILSNEKAYSYLVRGYINLGIVQRDLKDFKGARNSFLKGINLAEKNKITDENLALLFADLGQNYMDFGKDFDKAIYYLKKSIPIYEANKYQKGIEHAHRNLAYAYLHKKDYSKAIFHAKTAVEIAKTLNDNHRLFNSYNAMFRVSEASGDYRAAFENLKIAKAYEDSTLKKEKLNIIANVETKYQSVKKETEIAVLGEKNKAQRLQLWLLLGGIIVSIAFLGAIFIQNKKLNESRKQISDQADQLKLMMKELHHRVKNNLAIVSGLLRIQSSKLEDESAIQAVRQGQQRVDAMALIHQRLYQTDKITTVNIKEYITDLAESLMSAYGFEVNEFDLNISVENEELDVDLAIPLGLIINELLTNSFKYAYENTEKPALKISLKGETDLSLEIKDNGTGIDLDRWNNANDSFGKKMIAGLVKQIGGQFTIENENGTVFRMKIAA